MNYYNTANTPNTYAQNNNGYSNQQNYHNGYHQQNYHYGEHQQNWRNHYGNGYQAMRYANYWYPGWNAYYYRWYNNQWIVYLRHGNMYRTVYIGPNYGWHHYKSGYYW